MKKTDVSHVVMTGEIPRGCESLAVFQLRRIYQLIQAMRHNRETIPMRVRKIELRIERFFSQFREAGR